MSDRFDQILDQSTALDSGIAAAAPRPMATPCLFVVLEGERPLVGGARHSLGGVTEVTFRRGARRSFERQGSGKAQKLTVALPSKYLSGEHARLQSTPDGWVLEDLGSSNGTHVNGRQITRALLEPGDVISVGRVFLVIEEAVLDADDASAPDVDASDVTTPPAGLLTLWPPMASALRDLRRIARENVTVTLVGETGTGKEVLAEALHALSGRRGPYVAINCGAIPKELVESQLFGHKKGGFSGATGDASGSIRAAEGGTLLLDEIVSTREGVQIALLRAIQQRQVTPVGSSTSYPVDVRFVAASQIPLRDAVARGGFREDLRARLEGYVFQIPPLRERRVDLGVLVATLLRRHGVSEGANPIIATRAGMRLLRYRWPANIRELEQALVRSWALAKGGEIGEAHLPDPEEETEPHVQTEAGPNPAPAAPEESAGVHDAFRDELLEMLRVTGGNVAESARRLGRSRQFVHGWVKRLGLEPESFRHRRR
jgi:DNA-binding NtrC family response regulator